MKKYVFIGIAAFVFLLAFSDAFAQATIQRIGNFDYITRPNGPTITCQHIGSTTYCN